MANLDIFDAKSHSREWLFCLLGLAFTTLAACGGSSQPVHLSGSTMGTAWSVTYQGEVDRERAKAIIETELALVDSSMSTYRDDSEMARINRAGTAVWLELTAPFYEVLHTALQVGQASGGAYDVTVAPLVDLWGFGPEPRSGMPGAEQIAQALGAVGQQHIELDQANRRILKNTALRLDFSSLAKGYAVDRIAQALHNIGLVDFLVEVGGEMRLSGLSPRGDKWRIAIERPASDTRSMAAAVRLGDISVATSGDYRNFFEHEGQRYSHSIDPRSGWPVAHELVSVTVLHPSAMLADAWATALTVLGPEQGREVAQAEGLAVYFIQREGEEFSHSHSAAFEPYLEAGGREDI